jgi:homoserine O-acetyltransferase
MANVHLQFFEYHQSFPLTLGGRLPGFQLAFETWGTLNADGSNAVLLFPGLSASSHARSHNRDDAPGWWEGIVGPGLAIDTNQFFVICMNHLGGCFGSTGPLSLDPRTGKPFGPDFPALMIQDLARAVRLLSKHLGIDQVHAAVGASMGSLLAMEFAAITGAKTRRLIAISGSGRPGPQSIAFRFVQRQVILSDPSFHNGRYYEFDDKPSQALAVARMIGNITYRSAEEFATRFGRTRTSNGYNFGPDFQVESYLNHMGHKLADAFDANSFMVLSKAMDLYSLGYDLPSFEEGVLRIRAKALMIGVSTDMLFPYREQEAVHRVLHREGRESQFALLESPSGHDAFLVEVDWFGSRMSNFLKVT